MVNDQIECHGKRMVCLEYTCFIQKKWSEIAFRLSGEMDKTVTEVTTSFTLPQSAYSDFSILIG